MKKINLAFAQNEKEILYISDKVDKKLVWVPVNLETFLFFKKNKMKFINPINFFNNHHHKEALLESERLLKKIRLKNLKKDSLKKRYKGIMRKYFNSIYFLIASYLEVKKKTCINHIYLSGWNNFNFSNFQNNFFISKICYELFKKKEKIILLNPIIEKQEKSKTVYKLKIKKNFYKETVFFNNLNYKFTRFIWPLFFKNIKIYLIEFKEIKIWKKMILNLLGVRVFVIKKKKKLTNEKLNLENINFKFKNFELSKLLNYRKKQASIELIDLKEKFKVIKKFFSIQRPNLVLVNMARGYNGYISEVANAKSIPSVCISHGTISKGHNKYEKIYQKNIAEELIPKDIKHFALQTKITKKSFKATDFNNSNIDTGNIIFSENKFNFKKYILFAVTNRDFTNMHYYGIETFFEFYENLKKLDNLAIKQKLNFLVKLHPNISNLKDKLSHEFSNLKFTNIKIETALSLSFASISFSSTAIEDSLCSKVPVILFDQWSRYLHCEAEKNPYEKNKAVYYVNNSADLLKSIFTIKKSKKINFDNYIFKGSCKENIIKKLLPLMSKKNYFFNKK